MDVLLRPKPDPAGGGMAVKAEAARCCVSVEGRFDSDADANDALSLSSVTPLRLISSVDCPAPVKSGVQIIVAPITLNPVDENRRWLKKMWLARV
jgi:hypothetical protein